MSSASPPPPAAAMGGGDPSARSFQESVRSLLKGNRRNVLIYFEEQNSVLYKLGQL